MKIKFHYLALVLVSLLGSFSASSQHISAYAAPDRVASASVDTSVLATNGVLLKGASAAAQNVLGASGVSHSNAIPAPGNLITSTIYLPVVVKPAMSITGHLTQGGAPVGGLSLELWLYNGPSHSTAATATTDSSGYYNFAGVPAPAVGQSYNVVYSNPEGDVTRLIYWISTDITSSIAGPIVSLGTSDLADIILVVHPSTIALPYTFSWTRRAATPSDSYFWELFVPPDQDPHFRTDPFGYRGDYVLSSLPPRFSPWVGYGWAVGVVDANKGTGYSYYYVPVTFSNAGASISGPANIAPQTTGRRDYFPLPQRRQR